MAHHWRLDAGGNHDGAAGDLLGVVLYGALGLELADMTQDDIIRMAVTCQLITTANRDGIYMKALERFAELVRADEREACAKVCEDYGRAEEMQAIGNDYAQAIRARGNT
jgi:cytosine/adenosine deaminase-related metal-dependent hydrolase